MEMIDWLQSLLQDDNTKLYLVIVTYIVLNMLDFILGYFLAIFNGSYNSKKMKVGLATKVGMILLSVAIVPVFLMFDVLGLGTLYIVLAAFIANEMWSVIAHIRGNSDGKEHRGLDLLDKAIEKLLNKNEKE